MFPSCHFRAAFPWPPPQPQLLSDTHCIALHMKMSCHIFQPLKQEIIFGRGGFDSSALQFKGRAQGRERREGTADKHTCRAPGCALRRDQRSLGGHKAPVDCGSQGTAISPHFRGLLFPEPRPAATNAATGHATEMTIKPACGRQAQQSLSPPSHEVLYPTCIPIPHTTRQSLTKPILPAKPRTHLKIWPKGGEV